MASCRAIFSARGGTDARRECTVEVLHHERRVVVPERPASGKDTAGACSKEGAREAERAFTGHDDAASRLAGGQHDEPAAEIERRNLLRLQPAVLVCAAWRQEDRRAIGKCTVCAGVRGKMQNRIPAERRALEELFRRLAAFAHGVGLEPQGAGNPARLATRPRQRWQVQLSRRRCPASAPDRRGPAPPPLPPPPATGAAATRVSPRAPASPRIVRRAAGHPGPVAAPRTAGRADRHLR